jgi:hypothetical protein
VESVAPVAQYVAPAAQYDERERWLTKKIGPRTRRFRPDFASETHSEAAPVIFVQHLLENGPLRR